jgi:uncharacterized protein YecE (DUF72 family)
MASLWIGTSGWVYRHWEGIFYPPSLPPGGHLSYYAARFPSVEVNFTFYRLPERDVFEAWRRQTPAGFLFAVKGSRYLTHMKKLRDPDEPLSRLMERASGLEEKLGPLLFQFPHTWRADIGRLRAFLAAAGSDAPRRLAFEFRHASWLVPPVYAALEEAGAALCLPVHPTIPLDVRLTAPWTYIRMHGGRAGIGYDDEELASWAGRIDAFLHGGTDVYVYFNNDPQGHAVRDAARLRRRLAPAGTVVAGAYAGEPA